MFEQIKEKFKTKYSRKQALFIIIAFVLFLILAWLVVSNFIFLVDQLNQAFSTEISTQFNATKFDIETFQKLNLIQ